MITTAGGSLSNRGIMLIDCTTCVARAIACDDCVVTVLLNSPQPARPAAPVELDDAERDALGSLAVAGLIPPLRLVRAVSGTSTAAMSESA